MRPRFHPRLINPPLSDPGLFVPFLYEKRALLFDLGDLHGLTPRDLLKVSHVFVTHTHVDHFIGFDQLLRLLLGRDKELHLFGPPDFFDRVEGKFPIRTLIVNVGARRPLGIGAGSLALIAFLPRGDFERIVAANATRYPQYKNLTHQDVREMADRFRPLGYTISEGLFHDGVISIGIPLYGEAGSVVAAVTVSAISQRMGQERREAIVRLVREIARAEGPTFARH